MNNQDNNFSEGFYCPNCGQKNANNHNYCIFCGSTFTCDGDGNISQYYPSTVNVYQQGQNNQQFNSQENEKSEKKFGFLIVAGFFGLFSFLSGFGIIGSILAVILLFWYIKTKNMVLSIILKIIGVMVLGFLITILILLGTCFGFL